jgi:FtsX extracellular domain
VVCVLDHRRITADQWSRRRLPIGHYGCVRVGRWLGAIAVALLVAGCSSSHHATSPLSQQAFTKPKHLVIIMPSNVTEAQVAAMRTRLKNDRNVRSYRVLDRQDASKEWKQLFPRSTRAFAPPQVSEVFDVRLRTATDVINDQVKRVLPYSTAPGVAFVASGNIARSACPRGETPDNGGGCSYSESGGGTPVPSTSP